MNTYLGLGSNLGDRRANLRTAVAALESNGVRIKRVSPTVESPALLPHPAPADWNRPFLNLVAECVSDDQPQSLLERIKTIERELGRENPERWSPRPIDIDILLWGDEQISTDQITIPHPSLHRRGFVLTPLVALNPSLCIPGLGNTTVLQWSTRLNHHIPLWMGIVNLTPDSFSDGGQLADWTDVCAHVDRMVEAGAHIIDLGAESTRPGAKPLTPNDEWSRLAPALEQLFDKYRGDVLRPLISVDTYHPEVAQRAVQLGVDIINDVGGLSSPAMLELAGASGIASGIQFVAMHHVSLPADPAQVLAAESDPYEAVECWLHERLVAWNRASLDIDRIIVDPGIGFGKTALQSLQLMRQAGRLKQNGLRCLVGHSRKSFMTSFASQDTEERDLVSIGASLNLIAQGVDIIRVHNVPAHVSAYRGWAHLQAE